MTTPILTLILTPMMTWIGGFATGVKKSLGPREVWSNIEGPKGTEHGRQPSHHSGPVCMLPPQRSVGICSCPYSATYIFRTLSKLLSFSCSFLLLLRRKVAGLNLLRQLSSPLCVPSDTARPRGGGAVWRAGTSTGRNRPGEHGGHLSTDRSPPGPGPKAEREYAPINTRRMHQFDNNRGKKHPALFI
jgi:hypothetical protein